MFALEQPKEKAEYSIIWVRVPGLLAASVQAKQGVGPVIVSDAKTVRDVCPRAAGQGVVIGVPLARARRLCPFAWVVSLAEVNASRLSHALWDALADISPTVEPDGPDAAYADLSDVRPAARPDLLCQLRQALAPLNVSCGFAPLSGGRILFQDQVLDVVRVVGGYSPDEADVFLKAMTHARDENEMKLLGVGLMERAKDRGMAKKAFSKLWIQIQGFSRYGFCHGHSLAFADHAQGTAYLLAHYPAEFLASVLSVEPCGFWPVATVVQEARRRGIIALAPCVNRSQANVWSIENKNSGTATAKAIRCSLGFIQTVTPDTARAIAEEREERGPFVSLSEWGRRCAPFLSREQMEWLVLSGALDGLCSSRRRALWSLPSLRLFTGTTQISSKDAEGQQVFSMAIPPLLPPDLPDFEREVRFGHQFAAIGFGEEGHPIQRQRDALTASGVLPCAALQDMADGQEVKVAGWVLRPHRPPTPSGQVWVFFTLEDETGLAHVTVSPDVYERVGAVLFGSPALVVSGKAQKRGVGTLLLAEAAYEFDDLELLPSEQ